LKQEKINNKNNIEKIVKNENQKNDFWWKNNFSQIFINEFKKDLENSDVILIDIRTPWELSEFWKIRENQLFIDFYSSDFKEKINKLDKNKKYIIYCWHWNRSKLARDYMKKLGFKYVKDLYGWIDAWIKTWEKVVK
jgi:rhodanese-related sulfurtransferase